MTMRTSVTGVDTALELHLYLGIESATFEPSGDVIEPPGLEFDAATSPAPMYPHDSRIGTGGQSGEEEACVSVNTIKHLIAEVAQIEQQQALAYPWPDTQHTHTPTWQAPDRRAGRPRPMACPRVVALRPPLAE